jgi:hypothetical protein
VYDLHSHYLLRTVDEYPNSYDISATHPSQADEETTITFNVTDARFNTSTLEWTVQTYSNNGTIADDVNPNSGQINLVDGIASFSIEMLPDSLTEPDIEQFVVRINTLGNSHPLYTTSPITIGDVVVVSTPFYAFPEYVWSYTDGGSVNDTVRNYDVAEVNVDTHIPLVGPGRVYIAFRKSSGNFWHDVAVAAVQVVDASGALVWEEAIDTWEVSLASNPHEVVPTGTTLAGHTPSVDTFLAQTYTYGTVVYSTGATGQWSRTNSSPSNYTGAAHGIVNANLTYGSPLPVGEGVVPQVSVANNTNTEYLYVESSGQPPMNEVVFVRSSTSYNFTGGERIRIAYLLMGSSNAFLTVPAFDPNNSIFVGLGS